MVICRGNLRRDRIPRLGQRLLLFADPRGRSCITIFAVNVLFFGLVGLTIHHTGRPPLRPLRCGTLRYVGQISYGVYIFHFLILEKYEEFRPQTGTAICFDVLALLICLLVGALSWELLEKPLSRLKRRLAYERATEHALGSV